MSRTSWSLGELGVGALVLWIESGSELMACTGSFPWSPGVVLPRPHCHREFAISPLKRVARWIVDFSLRQDQFHPIHVRETVSKHWPIDLVQQIRIDFDPIVGGDTEQIPVVGSMMNSAKGKSICNRRKTADVRVRNNVGGVEKFKMFRAADRACTGVSPHDACPEDRLMKSRFHDPIRVTTLVVSHFIRVCEKVE